MSVSEQITRLQTAKANIKQAIIDKGGVTVEDTDTIDTFSDKIDTALTNKNNIIKGICDKTLTGDIIIPDGTSQIKLYTFNSCKGLTSINIPDSVTSIGNYAFYECSSLTSVTIPDSVTSLGTYIFQNCTSLTSITIPNSITSINDSIFRGCKGLTSITIPNSVTYIGQYAFYGCSGLTSITIPDSVKNMSNYVFYGCSGLTSITIPDSVTILGIYTFGNCTNLTSVTWKSSLTFIQNYTFQNCTSLQTLDLSASTQIMRFGSSATSTTVGTTSYINIHSGLQIIVPKDLYNDWKASTYWANFVNYLYWRDTDGTLKNTDTGTSENETYEGNVIGGDNTQL